MKHIFYSYLILALFTLGACSRELSELDADSLNTPIKVTLHFGAEHMQEVSRATDETTVRDLNLFLYGPQQLHLYVTSPSVNIECLPGQYTLYAVANIHHDLGELPIESVKELSTPYSPDYDNLQMSATLNLDLSDPNVSTQDPIPVTLTRNMAKIAYDISVDAQEDIRLQSVQICSIPTTSSLFSKEPSEEASDYRNDLIEHISAASATHWAGIAYVPENLQGTVSTITNQHDKDAQHAPDHATFLMIRATVGERILDYRVYLGENETSDFNVRRNSHHTLDIVIKGTDQVDTRVHGYTVSLQDTFSNLMLGDYYLLQDTPRTITLTIDRDTNDGMRFFGSLQLINGPVTDWAIDGISTTYHEFDFRGSQQSFTITYSPLLVTKANANLSYRLSLSDEYGYARSYEIVHPCANNISVKYQNGSITASGALHTSTSADTFRALCYNTGCTLTAHADKDYLFAGWYSDSSHTELLSSSATYTYKPRTTFDTIYARFDHKDITIYTDPQLVVFTSDRGSRLDLDQEAFIVPYGSRCTLTVDYQIPLFKGWYDKYYGQGTLLSTSRSYSFVATSDRRIYPGYNK